MVDKIKKSKSTAQTTGHAWDGDIQEFNNPLPNWWLWGFYATVIFSIVYWVFYPSWPIGNGYLKGAFNDIEYVTADGKSHKTHWNTRSLYLKEMQEAREQQQQYVDQVQQSSFDKITKDQVLSEFVNSTAKVLFADNCAPCHQVGGGGVIGAYPNLVDDSWLWGGSFSDIQNTIQNGHLGYMPEFADTLNEIQLHDVASYVLSLSTSGNEADANIAKGKEIFNGQIGGCHYCHGLAATGLKSTGSANLTDSIWAIANVPAAASYQEKLTAVKSVISNGVTREMPSWLERLSPTEIKILSVYVHELGGGK
ncbi:Cytochrome c oxidase (cbb3-type) subunit CcoP [hydrothermal vent metagenome]|uniref:Cytochrome c oxidase subunit III n=1 Tax=hydrothermal vent metagenome TaxID=652676 RepID=A0A3B1ANQ2_9ZZZZ